MIAPRAVFVDASAWIAMADLADTHHRAAAEYSGRLLQAGRLLVTTNLVVAEAYVAIRRVAGHRAAMRLLTSFRQSARLARVYADPDLDNAAEEILARYADQDFSFVDAVSFALMRRRGLAEAFAFDRHFLIAGFSLVPSQAS